jgi:hyperosmotically inducible protein
MSNRSLLSGRLGSLFLDVRLAAFLTAFLRDHRDGKDRHDAGEQCESSHLPSVDRLRLTAPVLKRTEPHRPLPHAEMQRMCTLMKSLCLTLLVVGALGTMPGCTETSAKSPDVSDSVRKSLDQAKLTDVSVSQDRDKGVVTLAGHVTADADKLQAESIARSLAAGQVVANEIAVNPPGLEREAKMVTSDLDKGIQQNLDAALIENGLHDAVKYGVRTGVVTLTGEVNSQTLRAQAGKIASSVPNVQQVVNELQVKDQKATSR